MSARNKTGDEQVVECPLCMELLEVDDLHFYPCTCGYQICRFCWNRLLESENGLCPACRKAYPENPADFTPLSQEQVAAIKTEKKAREQKRRNKTLESRKALANVRVVQNNLVFVVGLPVRLADPEILKRQEYFGKYGKIHKVVINQNTTYAGPQSPSASAYVTYVSPADALRAIQGVNNVTLDGRVLKGSLGTTKYCANFMKNQPCPKPDCMYLHEQGDPHASFTKEEMHAGLHQVYERKLHNQLLQAQRDRPAESNATGNSSTSAEKGSSKEGNQLNFIPTTVVTSSHINVVNSSKSKKESANGSGSGSSSGKEAWPSLGSSPPAADSPARKQSSPKPTHNNVKSQENGTSESSSPTQPPTQQTAHNKNKDTHTDNKRNKDVTSQNSKKNKSEKAKQKINSGITNESNDSESPTERPTTSNTPNTPTTQNSVFENTQQNYLSNELNELESDRHSLLENHDLLDNSDHSLLEDDSRTFLNNANDEVIMMQRHREMLADLVDNHHLMPKRPLTNGYGLVDRDMSYLANDRPISQISQGIMDQKQQLLMRERNRELLMRQNEMLARQHSPMVEPKHFMPTTSIGMDSTSELLGANFHSNPNMLPFGMRVDNSMGSMTANMTGNNINTNLTTNTLSGNNMATNTLNTMNNSIGNNVSNMFMLRNQQIMQQSGIANGFDTPQSAASETRYQADNMEKFFTDFHKAQQMRALLGHTADERRFPMHNMLSAERLEMEHKQRMTNMRMNEGNGMRAAGDCDDDLDFDPFKETQKAFAEMMETEMMQNNVSGDSDARIARFLPPGFTNLPGFSTHHQGYNSGSAMFSDWTQMDPAIMSTSAVSGKPPGLPLTAQQQEMFARFNQMAVQPNGLSKLQVPLVPQWAGAQKLNWPSGAYSNIPLPPGFAPTKPSQHPAECIDAK